MKNLFILSLFLAVISGCATQFGSLKRANNLYPGMTLEEAKGVLGEPDSNQFIAGKLVVKYWLHRYAVGYVPLYCVHNPKNGNKLESWYLDEREGQARMQNELQGLNSFAEWVNPPPPQKHDVNLYIHE